MLRVGESPDYGQFQLRYLSLGAGVQSSALYIMSALGLRGIQRVDVAVFADTQDEPFWVYDQLWRLAEWGAKHDGPPIVIVTAGRLSECDDSFVRLPVFTPDLSGQEAVITRRQCTREYKIVPIEQWARRAAGYQPRQRIPKCSVLSVHGISAEEIYRVKVSRTPWIWTDYPLVWAGIPRESCLDIWREHIGEPVPKRSACVFCPYRSNREWRDLRDNDPAGFQFAVDHDARIRNSTKAGLERPVYLHRSLLPLPEVDFGSEDGPDLFQNDCEGMCGV